MAEPQPQPAPPLLALGFLQHGLVFASGFLFAGGHVGSACISMALGAAAFVWIVGILS